MTSSTRLEGACITREQFLLREMRTMARLRLEGVKNEEAIVRVTDENLFQYPTTRMVRNIATVCDRRLEALGNDVLVRVIATGEPDAAAQANLYAMMRSYPLVRDFMETVVAEHYLDLDYQLGPTEMNGWVARVQAEYDNMAALSDSTIQKIKQVLRNGLVQCGMLKSSRSTELQRIVLDPDVEDAIRDLGDAKALAAFGMGGA